MVDWESLFSDNGVSFSRDRKYVTDGHIGISCPWCGSDDSAFHLGIQESTGYYHCWRDPSHSGKKIEYLLTKLFRRPKSVCLQELRNYGGKSFSDNTRQKTVKPDTDYQKTLDLFRPAFEYRSPLQYLNGRFFSDPKSLIRKYDLLYTHLGTFRFRIIFPFFDEKGEIVSFTGRDVTGKNPIRYKGCPTELSGYSMNRFFYNQRSDRGEFLVITEGPMDVLRLETACSGVSCWGLVGTHLGPERLCVLSEKTKTFSRIVLVLDSDQKRSAKQRLEDEVRSVVAVPVVTWNLPAGIKDIASMSESDTNTWVSSCLKNQKRRLF